MQNVVTPSSNKATTNLMSTHIMTLFARIGWPNSEYLENKRTEIDFSKLRDKFTHVLAAVEAFDGDQIDAILEKHNGDPRLQGATRLSDLGVEKQSSRWQKEASAPRPIAEIILEKNNWMGGRYAP